MRYGILCTRADIVALVGCGINIGCAVRGNGVKLGIREEFRIILCCTVDVNCSYGILELFSCESAVGGFPHSRLVILLVDFITVHIPLDSDILD